MQKKTLRFLLSFVLVISTVTMGFLPVGAAVSFTDVPDDAYYAEAVNWAVDKELTNGTTATTFSPGDECTRAQCVTFLYRYAGKPETNLDNISRFTDVSSDDYFAPAVAWALENEITTGTTDTTFSPGDKCTRAQIVTFLWRYNNKPEAEDTGSFVDVKDDDFYADAVSWAVEKDITKGTSETKFSPEQTCTRAQIVTLLYRMDQAIPSDDPYSGTIDLGPVNIGDYVTFGHYEQDNDLENGKEPIEWKVLDKADGRALLLSKYGLDCQKYNEEQTGVTWETCTLRNWLNSDFLNESFSETEKSAIPKVTLSNLDNPENETVGGNDTQDQVFLLSMQEVQQYFDLSETWTDYDGYIHDGTDLLWYFSEGGSKNLITSPTAYAKAHGAYDSNVYHDAEGNPTCYWWLRTPGDDSDSAVCINSAGGVDPDGDFIDNDNNAVRPALWVNLAS